MSIRFEVEDDATPEGTEEIVFELINAELDEFSTVQPLEVFVLNSVTVALQDNDGRLCDTLISQLAFFFLL